MAKAPADLTAAGELVNPRDRRGYPGGHHVWLRADRGRDSELDARVFAALAGHPGVEARDDGAISFPSEEAAVLALSWALVNVGREVVGLPPLDPVSPAGDPG